MTKENCIKLIEKAFKEVRFPGNRKLLHPDSCNDDSDILPFYSQAKWKNIPDNLLEKGYASLSFFGAEAYQFFLPAFMIWVLKNYEKSDSFTINSVINSLNPIVRNKLDAFRISKFAALNLGQKQSIAEFLAFLEKDIRGSVDGTGVNQALLNHWKQYLDCSGPSDFLRLGPPFQ